MGKRYRGCYLKATIVGSDGAALTVESIKNVDVPITLPELIQQLETALDHAKAFQRAEKS